MEEDENKLTDEKWRAIVTCDAASDGAFYYGVKTTGIFCRPSCKSKEPIRDNVRIFEHADAALQAGFRPCKRCRPTGVRLPDEEWVGEIVRYIRSHLHEVLSLRVLGEMCHGSPFHLQRTSKRITGKTPMEYVQQVRIEQAAAALRRSDKSLAEIAAAVGIPNTAYFITLFKKITGYTPADYRIRHANMEAKER
ncbi:bifunctional transcriptional activator/DNA repair enzyme AdaA [Gorillibacterium massiliense]|uniref:bifunctional transcriptional activator/DNA repair enzyme AdaA n=1 Tax=Gorillibacterium massiliense TaxID=1280390 RepID=UPI0004B38EF2|nr:bifunctional transcriptional activator/DNA repair enzyme AdaA [Gorillibacterium massiliense]